MIKTPVFIAKVSTNCWKCKQEMPVVRIIGYGLPDEPNIPGSVSFVEEMDKYLLEFIRRIVPHYSLQKTASWGSAYYANVCPKCNSVFGDFHLDGDVDTPFFPDYGAGFKDLEVCKYPTEDKEILLEFGVSGFGQEEEILTLCLGTDLNGN